MLEYLSVTCRRRLTGRFHLSDVLTGRSFLRKAHLSGHSLFLAEPFSLHASARTHFSTTKILTFSSDRVCANLEAALLIESCNTHSQPLVHCDYYDQ